MVRRKNYDTPSWLLKAAEAGQFMPNNLIKLIAGSSYPGYVQAKWHTIDHVISTGNNEPTRLPVAEANPDATFATALLPRLKDKAAIVETRSHLSDIRNNIKGIGRIAVAFTYKEITRIGDVPGEITNFFTSSPYIYRAAMRAGRSELGVGIGVWVPNERAFIIPEDCKVVDNNVSIDSMDYKYPGIRLF
jgi:hypothetical protein